MTLTIADAEPSGESSYSQQTPSVKINHGGRQLKPSLHHVALLEGA